MDKLKYKHKYLEYKHKNIQLGGTMTDEELTIKLSHDRSNEYFYCVENPPLLNINIKNTLQQLEDINNTDDIIIEILLDLRNYYSDVDIISILNDIQNKSNIIIIFIKILNNNVATDNLSDLIKIDINKLIMSITPETETIIIENINNICKLLFNIKIKRDYHDIRIKIIKCLYDIKIKISLKLTTELSELIRLNGNNTDNPILADALKVYKYYVSSDDRKNLSDTYVSIPMWIYEQLTEPNIYENQPASEELDEHTPILTDYIDLKKKIKQNKTKTKEENYSLSRSLTEYINTTSIDDRVKFSNSYIKIPLWIYLELTEYIESSQ